METQLNTIKLEVGVKVFLKNTEGKYLALRRAKPYPGLTETMWDAPGGRINPGETLEQALAREVKEETAMTLNSQKPSLVFAQDILRVQGRHIVRLTYTATAFGEIELDPNEHTEFKWVTLPEFINLYHDTYLDPVLVILNK